MSSNDLFDSIRENLNGRKGQPMLFGVCNTLAERSGQEPWLFRAAAILLTLFFTGPANMAPYPGSGEDVLLTTGVNGPVSGGNGNYIKTANGGDLIACTGTESSGSRKTEVMYIVTTDRNKKMNSGGPLAIRCSIQQAQVRGCNIVDRGRGDFIIDAILDQGEYSTSSIEQAWKSALAPVDARRK